MMAIDLANFDLTQIPATEDDAVEFKSSATPITALSKKLGCAVSGFANSGGGLFVAGVDKTGNADGGFSTKVGGQDMRDWIDQVVHQVQPTPAYEVKLLDDAKGRGSINANAAVVVVRIAESQSGPHMAPDYRYYIRAGAHTVSARHFLVEAIWARRHFTKPQLVHLADVEPYSTGSSVLIIQLIAIAPAPALDVEAHLSPHPATASLAFPLWTSLIDQAHPFSVRFQIPNQPTFQSDLTVAYRDVARNQYKYTATIDAAKCVPSWHRGAYALKEIARAIDQVNRTLERGH
jgi:hypothetical protein